MDEQQGTEVPTAWLVRAGRAGEDEESALETGRLLLGFNHISDLTEVTSRSGVRAIVEASVPEDAPVARVSNWTGQLWALCRVKQDDLVVLPLKKSSQIALGIVTEKYKFITDEEGRKRHSIFIDWQRTDIPRTAVRQDLLHSLGAAQTVCQIKRNDGDWRLQQLMETGVDPGARVEVAETAIEEDMDVDTSESSIDIERMGRDKIQTFVGEKFSGHGLERLVAAVLSAEGFITQEAPRGADGGIDIFAGRGSLGFDSPRVIVQVKSSPTPVDTGVVRELHGVLSTHGADQALLVAWGGANKAARQELRNQFFRIRVWDADDLLNAVFRNYERLSEEIRADLPLKRIWSLVEE